MKKLTAFLVLVLGLASCEKSQELKSPQITTESALEVDRCTESDVCDASCFEQASGHCEGRWGYPAQMSCYKNESNANCGLVVAGPPHEGEYSNVCERRKTIVGSYIDGCEDKDEFEKPVEKITASTYLKANLPADYMRYFYEVGSEGIVAKMSNDLVALCGSEDVAIEIAKIQDQCFPLASDIGTPDQGITNFFESLELVFNILEGVSACENPQGLDVVTLIANVGTRVLQTAQPQGNACIQRPEDMGPELRDYMENVLVCPEASIDLMIDNLFSVFYGRVKKKVERVIDTQCASHSGEVYELMLSTIENYADESFEQALVNDLNRQCRNACYEMSYYWSCDDQYKVCVNDPSSQDCVPAERQCPADESISDKVILSDVKCDTKIDEPRFGDDAEGNSQASTVCTSTLSLPREYDYTTVTTRTCRVKENGEESEPVTCIGDEYDEEYIYSQNGLHRVEAENILLGNLADPDPGELVCLTGDDMFDWTKHRDNALEVSAVYDRLMSATSRHEGAFIGVTQGSAFERVWHERLKLLGEFYGDLLFEGQYSDDEQELAALKKFYTNLAWLYERYPSSTPECLPSGEFTSTPSICGHDRDQTKPLWLVNFPQKNGFRYTTSPLAQGTEVGTGLVLETLPLGMRDIHYIKSSSAAGLIDEEAGLSFRVNDIATAPNSSNDATVSIIYDPDAEGLGDWFKEQSGWRFESELGVEVSSGGEVRRYRVVSKDFKAGDEVFVPSHLFKYDGKLPEPWKYFATVHPTHFTARVEMCERYLGERATQALEAHRAHPMSSVCMKRLATAAQSRADESNECLDALTRKALSVPVQLTERDIATRQYMSVVQPTGGMQTIQLNATPVGEILVNTSSWRASLEPAVAMLDEQPVVYATPSPFGSGLVTHRLLNNKVEAIMGSIHAGLGTQSPWGVGTSYGDHRDQADLLELLYDHYDETLDDTGQMEDDKLMALLQRWRQETHSELLHEAHHTQGVSPQVFLAVMGSTLEFIQAKLDAGIALHDSICTVSENCGYSLTNSGPNSPVKESFLSSLWEMQRTVLDANAPFWNANDSRSPLYGSKPLQRIQNDTLKSLYDELNQPNSTGHTPRSRARLYITSFVSTSDSFYSVDDEETLSRHHLVGFRDSLSAANTRRQSFLDQGTLAANGLTVKTGMHHDNMIAMFSRAQSSLDSLATSLDTMYNDMQASERSFIDEFDQGTQQNTLNRQLQDLFSEYDKENVELEGLQLMHKSPSERMSSYMGQIEELSSDANYLAHFEGTYVPISGAQYQTEIAGSDATFSQLRARGSDAMESMHVPWEKGANDVDFIEASEGDVLTVDVNGLWAPDCALNMDHAYFEDVTGQQAYDIPSPALISSEGYIIAQSSGTYDAVGSSTTSQTEARLDACAGIGIGGNGTPLFAQVKGCLAWTKSWSDTESDGARLDSSISTQRGYRINEGVPFPEAPVGSLLLVGVSPPSPSSSIPRNRSHVRSVAVVRGPRFTVTIPERLNYYLVINDQSHSFGGSPVSSESLRKEGLPPGARHHEPCSGRAPSLETLKVRAILSEPVEGLVEKMSNNMIAVLEEISQTREGVLHAGSLFSTTLDSIRANAFNRFYQSSSSPNMYLGNFSDVPEAVRVLFDSWIAAELDALQVELAMSHKRRRLRELERLIFRVMEDVEDNEELRGTYISNISTSLQQRIQGNALGTEVDIIKTFIFEYMLPLMSVRGEGVTMTALALLSGNSLDELLNESVTLTKRQIAKKMVELFGDKGSFKTQFSNDIASMQPLSAKWAVVSYPRPELRDEYYTHYNTYKAALNSGDIPAQQVARAQMQAVGLSEDISWADDFRTDTFWNALNNERIDEPLPLQVLPEDLYLGNLPNKLDTLSYTMNCAQIEPVVLDTVILFNVDRSVGNQSDYPDLHENNAYNSDTLVSTDSAMTFVTKSKPVPTSFFESDTSGWLANVTYTGFITGSNDLSSIMTGVLTQPNGQKKSGLGLAVFRTLELDKAELLQTFFNTNGGYPRPIQCKRDAMSMNNGVLTPAQEDACDNAPLCDSTSTVNCRDLRVLNEVLVLTRYEYRTINTPLDWLESCK